MPHLARGRRIAKGAENAESEAGAETVIATLEGINTTPENPAVFMEATATLVTEAEGEEVELKIRRGSVTGTEVAGTKSALGASAKGTLTVFANDNPGEVAAAKYVLTLKEKKATKKVKAVTSSITGWSV